MTLALGVLVRVAAAAEADQDGDRVPPALRAKMLMALLGVVMLGAALAGMILIYGRMVRRHARHEVGESRVRPDAWADKRLVPPLPSEADEGDDDG